MGSPGVRDGGSHNAGYERPDEPSGEEQSERSTAVAPRTHRRASRRGTCERTWTERREAFVRPVYDAVVAALDPMPNDRLLHAACGTGTALGIAARRGAAISGLDGSPDLLTAARQRVPDADLRVGAIDELPYDRGCFDQVMAFETIQYAEDLAAVIAELTRVTRPGGLVAIGLWNDTASPAAATFLQATRTLLPTSWWCDGVNDLAELTPAMTGAGLDVYLAAEASYRYDFPDLDAAWWALTSSRQLSRVIEIAGGDVVREVFMAHLAPHLRANGSIRQDNLFQYAVGRAPR